MTYKLLKQGVLRVDDNAYIPAVPSNVDYKNFLAWVEAGNVPQAADPDPLPTDYSSLDNLDKTLKAVGLTIAQITGTPVATVKQIFTQKYNSLP